MSGSASFVEGTGDAEACQARIQEELLGSCEYAPGRYRGEQPLSGQFMATENFFHVHNALSLPLHGGLADMSSAAKDVCARALAPRPGKPAAMESSCFNLSYQVSLLRALGARPDLGVGVDVVHRINGGDVDWVLGAALVRALEDHARPAIPEPLLGGFVEA